MCGDNELKSLNCQNYFISVNGLEEECLIPSIGWSLMSWVQFLLLKLTNDISGVGVFRKDFQNFKTFFESNRQPKFF